MATAHIHPVSGSECARRTLLANAASPDATPIAATEVHCSTDGAGRVRFLRANVNLGRTYYLGAAASEAAMLALDQPGLDQGACLPGDWCWRSDLRRAYRCISGYGTELTDWEQVPLSITMADISGVSSFGLAWLELTGSGAAKTALAITRDDITNATALGRGLLALATPETPKLPKLNADGTISLIDLSDAGGSGAGIWRTVTGDASAVTGGGRMLTLGSAAHVINCDALAADETDLLEIDCSGTGAVYLQLLSQGIYRALPPQRLIVRRSGANLCVSRAPGLLLRPSVLGSLYPDGLQVDTDMTLLTGNQGDSITTLPSTVGSDWIPTSGLPTVNIVGTRKGAYFGAGIGARCGSSGVAPGDTFTIAIAASSSHSGGGARLLNAVGANWLVGPYGGNWQHFNGGFSSMRAAAGDLMVIVLSRTPSGSTMYWRQADGTMATSAPGAGSAPGDIRIGIGGQYGESAMSTLFHLGLWTVALDATEAADVFSALASRYAFP